ncbi:ferritin-like domain-containing protein [Mycena sanguinolenta]|nr:ferritin-like domain-containing protein [Mycena sanguinolenta]
MRYSSTLIAAVAAPLFASALPVQRRASANDVLVFQFANVLEQLETTFYSQGLQKFQDTDFSNAGFSSSLIATQTLSAIQNDEATHTTVLQSGIQSFGAQPLICNFNFDNALTDVPTMAATARAVELVGVAAYLGAATLVDDPVLLDSAASILTVEARHQTLLNVLSGASSIPGAFDVALTPQETLSIAGGFITGPCDTGITPTNTLTITNSNPQPGDLLQFQAANITGTDGLFCNMIVGGAPFAINLPLSQCNVPPGINGPVMVWVTSDDNPLVNNVIDRDTTKQVAGPAIIFVDTQSELLGQMVRNTGTSSGATSTETTTITPDQASSVIAGAATQTASSSQSTDASGANGAAAPPPQAPVTSGPTPDGPSPDGHTTVNGLTQVPKPANGTVSASTDSSSGSSATDSSSASATDSASASATSSADPSATSSSS